MDIFIGNLPQGVNVSEVRSLLGLVGTDTKFSLVHKKGQTGKDLQYIVARVEPDKQAASVIARTFGARLHGQPLIIREFQHRDQHKDRRFEWQEWREDTLPNHRQRRLGDRRVATVYDDRSALISAAVPGRTWRQM